MDSAREKLIKELNALEPRYENQEWVESVAEFIIADRKRIVEPLVKAERYIKENSWGGEGANMKRERAIKETLKNAGLE